VHPNAADTPVGGVGGASLWSRLERKGGRRDLLLAWDGASYREWSWEDWRERAGRFAEGLKRRGIQPEERVAVLLTNSPDACAAVIGAWLAGACVLSMPLIARGMEPTTYLAQLRRIVARAEPVLLVCDESLRPLLDDAELGVGVVAFQQLDAPRSGEYALPGADQPVFVQYSSGSTSDPRGCVLAPRAIANQLAALDRALAIDPDVDTGVVWLPLAHDMGLFGCLLLTYWTGHRLVLGTPQRFLTSPGTWFADCARYGATVSATPSFGLALATRVAAKRLPPPFPMTRMVVGGERVDAATLTNANQVLGDERLKMSALVPAYGLAEAVLAVTMTSPGEGPTVMRVDAEALGEGSVVPVPSDSGSVRAVSLVSAGQPLPGTEVGVTSSDGVGEILVRSSTLADGYLGAPELTARRFTSRGLLTGDLGFVADGKLFVSGRADDLMSVAGRNVYARDLEAAICSVPGVQPGSCAVVEADEGVPQRLAAVVELRGSHPDLTVMAAGIRAAARAAAGAAIDRCIFVPRGTLPKTPSGKVQRFRCRELAQEGDRSGEARGVVLRS
jgi:fatty-acyl-CoA synthase